MHVMEYYAAEWSNTAKLHKQKRFEGKTDLTF